MVTYTWNIAAKVNEYKLVVFISDEIQEQGRLTFLCLKDLSRTDITTDDINQAIIAVVFFCFFT